MGSNWPCNESSYNRDARLLCSWNVGFEPRVLALHRWLRHGLQALRLSHCSDVKTRTSTLAFLVSAVMLRCSLQALCLSHCSNDKTRAWSSASWPLHEWLWLALRLKYRLWFLMTCPQWFLDSLQNPLQSFQNSAVDWDRFWNTLDFSFNSNAFKTGLTIFWDILSLTLSEFLVSVNVLLNSLEPPEMIIVSVWIRSLDLLGALSWLLVYCWTGRKYSSACASVLLNWLQKKRPNASLIDAEVMLPWKCGPHLK